MVGLATRLKKKVLGSLMSQSVPPQWQRSSGWPFAKRQGLGFGESPVSEHSTSSQLAKAESDSDHAFGNEQSRASSPPVCFFFSSPFLILISKWYRHLILMCSFLQAVYHINGSAYCWEYFPCTMICNPLVSTSCILLVHIQFNL